MTMDRSAPPAPGPIRPFEFPTIARSRLDNGLTVLHTRRGALPLVTVRAVLDAGGAAERPGEEGLAWLTAHALEGGTARRSGQQLAWELERLGAQLETWTTWDGLQVGLTTRADRLTAALALLAEILREPAFPDDEVERLRGEQLAEIMRRSTEPRSLADDAVARCIFAADEPYARPLIGTPERVASFTRDDVAAYHHRCFVPAAAGIIIVGAVAEDAALREAESVFGDWSAATAGAAGATGATGAASAADSAGASDAGGDALARNDATTVYVVDRASAVQSELRIGHVGVPRHHPQYYALLVLNTLVGGAFTSRLNLSLREKHGFTYGVRSAFSFRRGAGPFVIQTAVASDVTARAVAETLRELHAVRDGSIDADEVAAARDYLAGTLPLSMQTTEQIAARVADVYTYDLSADYFDNFADRVGAVSLDDVRAAARAHLHLDRLAVVVVGSSSAVTDELRALEIGDVVHEDAPAPQLPGAVA
jgi:zinc protease